MKVEVGITAHHNGQFLFRICRINAPAPGQTWAQAEKAQMTNECFNQVCWAASGWRTVLEPLVKTGKVAAALLEVPMRYAGAGLHTAL